MFKYNHSTRERGFTAKEEASKSSDLLSSSYNKRLIVLCLEIIFDYLRFKISFYSALGRRGESTLSCSFYVFLGWFLLQKCAMPI